MAGIELECSYNDYLQWLPSIRPYKSLEELPWKEFVDQCYLVYFEYSRIKYRLHMLFLQFHNGDNYNFKFSNYLMSIYLLQNIYHYFKISKMFT